MERPTLDKFPASVLAQIDIQTAFIVSRLIIAAERIQIFRVLHSKNMTAETWLLTPPSPDLLES